MTPSVEASLDGLRKAFPGSTVSVLAEDGNGGAFVAVETVALGARFVPSTTWVGAHLPSNLPYADIYPVFIGGDVKKADGTAFVAPVTPTPWQARPAWQVSRRNNRMMTGQTAAAKFVKVLDFLRTMP